MGSQRRRKKQAQKRKKFRLDPASVPRGAEPRSDSPPRLAQGQYQDCGLHGQDLLDAARQEGGLPPGAVLTDHPDDIEAPRAAAAGKSFQPVAQNRNGQPPRNQRTSAVAHRRVLIGGEGEPQAVLTSSSDEGVWLTMLDAKGNLRVRLGVDEAGLPSLMFFTAADVRGVGTRDRCSIERLALECTPDPLQPGLSLPALAMRDASGNRQAVLIAGPSGGSSLTFYGLGAELYGWSLHSLLGLTQYTSRTTSSFGDGLPSTLSELAAAEQILKTVRDNGKPLGSGAIQCLMSVYSELLI